MSMEEKTMKSEKIYEGRIINVRIDTVELPDKKYSKREIVEHPGAVGIVPITSNGEIVLVKQYRKAVERALLEIPAGRLEAEEDPSQCAIRELKEETGYTADSLEKMLEFYSAPGFSTEKIYIYLADSIKAGIAEPDEGEHVETLIMPLDRALEMVKRGEIKDSKTIIAILAYFNLYG